MRRVLSEIGPALIGGWAMASLAFAGEWLTLALAFGIAFLMWRGISWHVGRSWKDREREPRHGKTKTCAEADEALVIQHAAIQERDRLLRRTLSYLPDNSSIECDVLAALDEGGTVQ